MSVLDRYYSHYLPWKRGCIINVIIFLICIVPPDNIGVGGFLMFVKSHSGGFTAMLGREREDALRKFSPLTRCFGEAGDYILHFSKPEPDARFYGAFRRD